MKSSKVYLVTETRCEGEHVLGCSGRSRVVGVFFTREAAMTAAQKMEPGVGDVHWEPEPANHFSATDYEVAAWRFSVVDEYGWSSGRLQLHALQLDEPASAPGCEALVKPADG